MGINIHHFTHNRNFKKRKIRSVSSSESLRCYTVPNISKNNCWGSLLCSILSFSKLFSEKSRPSALKVWAHSHIVDAKVPPTQRARSFWTSLRCLFFPKGVVWRQLCKLHSRKLAQSSYFTRFDMIISFIYFSLIFPKSKFTGKKLRFIKSTKPECL